ncbi:MAG: zinc ribbon domain-containing protein [Candidatus Omnitrophota bacterium]
MAGYICPNCGKPIYDDEALLCLYCGESLRRSAGFMGKLKYSGFSIAFSVIILCVVIAFILLIIR